jgi:hypothetical protein
MNDCIRRTRAIAILLASSLLLASCGTSDGEQDSEEPVVVDPEEGDALEGDAGEGDAGVEDAGAEDDAQTEQIDTVPEFFAPAVAEDYGQTPPELTVIAGDAEGVQSPNDLAFHPADDRKDELWILNEGTSFQGGQTVTLYNAGHSDQQPDVRRDGNAWHFMSMPTALAFGDNGNWATGVGVQDANHSDGTFAGPSLWSSDMDVYAEVGDPPTQDVNGSHLDMLHGSPFAMGIAHETDNAYWVFDGYHGYIVRYDFQTPHPAGGHDHSNGLVHRYKEVEIEHQDSVPSHMILDKDSGWLYINDTGNQRIIRMDINTGSMLEELPMLNEPLEEHWEMHEVDWEVFVDDGLDEPAGMTLVDNRLFVTDQASGELIAYDIDTAEELARVDVGEGVRGVTVGPDDKLWLANYQDHEVLRVDPQ